MLALVLAPVLAPQVKTSLKQGNVALHTTWRSHEDDDDDDDDEQGNFRKGRDDISLVMPYGCVSIHTLGNGEGRKLFFLLFCYICRCLQSLFSMVDGEAWTVSAGFEV